MPRLKTIRVTLKAASSATAVDLPVSAAERLLQLGLAERAVPPADPDGPGGPAIPKAKRV